MMLMYGTQHSHYRLNTQGERLVLLIEKQVAEANRQHRAGLQMAAEGLVQAVDILRGAGQWTAVAALLSLYGFADEKDFTVLEYAALASETRR